MGSVDLNIGKNISFNQKMITSTNQIKSQSTTIEQQPKPNEEGKFTETELNKAVNNLNGIMEKTNTSLKYEYHEELKTYYVTLVNDNTHEVIREIPPKKLLDMYASMKEFMGLFVDNKI